MFRKLLNYILEQAQNYLGGAQARNYSFSDGPRIEQPEAVPYNAVRWADENVELGVESSNVVSVRYDNILRELQVKYRPSKKSNGEPRKYLYTNFPYDSALSLFRAPSLGRHINRNSEFHAVGTYRLVT